MRARLGGVIGAWLALGLSVAAPRARGEPYRPSVSVKGKDLSSITFSRLVIRLTSNEIGVEGDHLRVQILETMRKAGYNALGAESLVFDRDESAKARFALGGTANQLWCRPPSEPVRRCWLGVTWELLDRDSNEVRYRVHTRHASDSQDPKQLADELVWGNLYSLLSRQRFVAALGRAAPVAASPAFQRVGFKRCARGATPMPASAEALMQATVVVEAGDRVGSGTVVSPDGFVLTAAHVVESESSPTFQQRGGPRVQAVPIRVDPHRDVALLKPTSGSDYPCVAIREVAVTAGEDLFAIGSPLGKELSFSLTRGVVSGTRQIDGVSLIQTDASINRGNSGGPLLDSSGRLVGVVSWKVAGSGVEGIAFGVAASSALTGLGLEPADATAVALTQPMAVQAKSVEAVDDAPDPDPGLYPPPRPVAAPKPEAPRGPKTKLARTLGLSGLVTAGVGAVGVGATYGLYEAQKGDLTRDKFDNLRLANDVSWLVLFGGAGMWAVSELLPRDAPPTSASRSRAPSRGAATWSVAFGPGSAALSARY
ncbi:MAG: serine protease [Polyangiaceae bacterium]